MSKKFNLDDYTGKYVMCCKTEEEAKDFCRVLHEAGRKWSSGDSYLENTYWDCDNPLSALGLVGKNRYYQFNEGMYSTRSHFVDDYEILYWSDFMKKEFTKDDLRNGDVVLRRNGDVEIFLAEIADGLFMDKNRAFGHLSAVFDDLTGDFVKERDIIAVRRPNTLEDMSFDAFEKKLGRLVYERKETVEMTIEEVCKALGKNVKIVKG